MINKINFFKILCLFYFTAFVSCETLDMDQTENPSTLNEQFLDPIYTFNFVQLNLADFVDSANGFTQRVTRQMAMTGGNNYDNAFQPINFNDNWSTAYRILNAIKIMEPKAYERNETYALGACKIIRVYILMTLVDMYGDIPYSEALQGNENLFPKYDNGADVYRGLLTELDIAKSILLNNPKKSSKTTDLYYKSETNWITLANTIKLKMLNNARLAGNEIGVNIATEMNRIVTENNIIDTQSEDFAFQYGTSRFIPNTRHPLYNDQYELGGGAYISNYMFWCMTIEKGFPSTFNDKTVSDVRDPRTDFYFYKQDSNPGDETDFVLPGRNRIRPSEYGNTKFQSFYYPQVKTPFTISNWVASDFRNAANVVKPSTGYWGRDHGDNSGIPQDAEKRTVAGFYPIGGIYSSKAGTVQTSGNKGALGAGIIPIILSSYVQFILSEAILTGNVSGDARSKFISGINQSIDKTLTKINNYPLINDSDEPYPSNPEGVLSPGTYTNSSGNSVVLTLTSNRDNYSTYGYINIRDRQAYLNFMTNEFDNASSPKKLEIVMKEYFIASWGNGIEPYNNYRRTGYPSNFQPTIEPVSGDYFYKALYPASAINNNGNVPTAGRTKRVFWDKANLILH